MVLVAKVRDVGHHLGCPTTRYFLAAKAAKTVQRAAHPPFALPPVAYQNEAETVERKAPETARWASEAAQSARLADESVQSARKEAGEARKAAEAQRVAEERKAAEARKAAADREAAEERKAAEDRRKAAEARKAAEERKVAEERKAAETGEGVGGAGTTNGSRQIGSEGLEAVQPSCTY